MAVTKQQIIDQLRTVNDPELHKDLVTLKSKHSGPMGLIKNHSISHFVL